MHTLQKQGIEPQRILKTVNANRRRQRIEPASSSAAYRFLSGESYTRLGDDARGRPSKIGRKELAVYDAVRKRLQKTAKNEFQVTWEDIATQGQKELRKRKLLKRNEIGLSAESLRKRCRKDLNIGRRPAPRHASRTDDDETRRVRQAKA